MRDRERGRETERETERIDPLAEAIADRSDIDWDRERSSATTDPGLLRALEVISHVSRATDDPPATLEPLPDGTAVPASWGTLRLETAIGHGAFGTVFRARDLLLDQPVALKVLRPGGGPVVGRLIEEGRRLARLRHPNIVNVICIDQHDELIGLRMELVEGTTVAELVDEQGPLTEAQALEIGLPVCRALAAAHAAGILHRDVKARNIMRDPNGRVVLMDLGAGIDHDEMDTSNARGLVGTPLYIAPEILAGESASPRSDIYSFGVLLYHLVSGEYPVHEKNVGALCAAFQKSTMTPLGEHRADLSSDFLDVVDRALAFDPRDRHESAEAMAALLQAIISRPAGDEFASCLPTMLTRFVGRHETLREIRQLLADHRVITLVGAGGCGKTRIAIEIGWKETGAFPDGVWLVELAPIQDASLVVSAISSALGVKEAGSGTPLDALVDFLADKRALVLLDNCEHVVRACAEVATRIATHTADVRVLATSREALRTPGEITCEISPLRLPADTDETSLDRLAAVESVALFADRARTANARFTLTDENAPEIARICRRVDGIPLAIELAAVHVGSLPIGDIARRIDAQFLELGKEAATGLPHHHTLRTLIGWSYDLLSRAERILLRRLSVFAGGWTLDSATDVCAADDLDAADVPSLHFQLVSRSLIVLAPEVDPVTGGARYRMLDTIRAFAAERADAEGERVGCQARHRHHFRSLTREVTKRRGAEQNAWLSRLDGERDNVRVALRSSQDDGDIEGALEMAANLAMYWEKRGHWHEARAVNVSLVAHPDAAKHPELRAKLLRSAGSLAAAQGDRDEAMAYLTESLAILRELDDRAGVAHTLNNLAILALDRDAFDVARGHFSEALRLRRELGDTRGVIQTLVNLGVLSQMGGDLGAARGYLEEGLSLSRAREPDEMLIYTLRNLATVNAAEGRLEESRALLDEALEKVSVLDLPYVGSLCTADLGALAMRQGRLDEARETLERALCVQLDLGDVRASPDSMATLALVAEAAGEPRRAVQLLAAARRRKTDTGQSTEGPQGREVVDAIERLRDALGEKEYLAAWATGEETPAEAFLDDEASG